MVGYRTQREEADGSLHYDPITKSILQSLGNSLTQRLTGAKPIQHLSVEFGSVEWRVPDLVSQLDDGPIFHLEVQSSNDTRMPQRMLRYWLLLRERFEGVPVVQHVLCIGERPCSMASHIEEESVSYRVPKRFRDLCLEPYCRLLFG